ncbi:contact-dependent growth inhibition system immunity protein [Streptomyces coelicoflavus]|uniref:contact-dependent growth inhibition system immunity protein n=1 Tax=Streptomyces coelicoflavus TaxID=285562 RepID=UPI000D593A44|nr:contact-dependent growth inhibition system immunity protein [Streptomyces coelicoflavus]
MSMTPLEHDRRYGELDQVMRAYLGQPADDTPAQRSRALDAYLRHTWHTRPWAVAEAERQLREYSRNPPGRIRHQLGEFYAIPDTGLSQREIGDWLSVLADHLKKSVAEGDVPKPSPPQTHWEWHARFPETAQLLGGWFSQDIVDEFPDHDAAVADYVATTDPHLVARVVGELNELLALPLDEGDYALAAAELGMEVGPPEPFSYGAWFQLAVTMLSGV